MDKVRPETCTRFNDFLSGKLPQIEAFQTWAGGTQFDSEVLRELTALLAASDLAPDTVRLTPPARGLANRRFLEQAFAPALRPMLPAVVAVLDIATGKVVQSWPVPLGGALKVASGQLLYVISGGTEVLSLDLVTGKTRTLVKGLQNAKGITVDAAGKIYVSVGEPDMQVIVFNPKGREVTRIGRKGGRAPQRVSVWDLTSGKLATDFFGPTQYAASGSGINPRDPNLMVGVGCEWGLDPKTGKSVCVGAFDRQYHSFATFREGTNGRLYLYTDYGHAGMDGVQV